MSQIQNINVPGLGPQKIGDYLHTRLRSAIRPATNQSTELSFFKAVSGDAIAGDSTTNLSDYDTNLQQADGLPPGWAALIYFLSIEFPQTMTGSEMQDVNAKTLIELVIGSTRKVLDDGHVIQYPTGGGIFGISNVTDDEQWNNGFPSGGARTPYAVPHLIPSNPRVPYRVTAKWPATALAQTSRYTWFCLLEGIVRQPVA